MSTKRKTKSLNRIIILSVAMMACFIFLMSHCVKATDSCDSLEGDAKDKCDEINRKAQVYRQIIEIKEKQGETLNNQLEITAANIQKVQTQLDLSTQQIDDLNSQIVRLGQQIKEKDDLLESQKKILGNIVQSYYEANQTGVLAAYLSGGSIASFIVNKDRISQMGDKIQELVRSITKTKKELEDQSAQLDQKKGEFVKKNQQYQDQSEDLSAIKKQRETLLTQTQGEEVRYRQLLANVEAQKQQLLDIDQYFTASGLSADSYPKPDSKYFASTSWYFSQWDSRWGNETIGNTKTKMKSYGCAVTAVAMVFMQQDVSMTPGKLANQPIYSGDLINWYDSKDWAKSWPVPDSKYGYNHGNINWSVVDSKISKGIPVIVYIKKSNGGGGHYVVIHNKDSKGKYVVHDPYFGANIFLNTSRALVGAMGKKGSTSVDQMIIYE